MTRIQLRRTLIFISFLFFPVTMWYFSPYLIIQAAFEHIINGSFIVFGCMFVFSLFFGRVWCGYLCPAGGLQECAMTVNNTPAKLGKRKYMKYGIWLCMIGVVSILFVLKKQAITIDFFYMTDHGVSVTEVYNYIIYYGVLFLLSFPALICGRRASCHYLCWMAPFMILGSKIGQFLHLPQLHMEANSSLCVSCQQCNKACPMGLDVVNMVKNGTNGKNRDCIQCGECVEACPKKVIKYSMKWEK